jgi:hypothetical protein
MPRYKTFDVVILRNGQVESTLPGIWDSPEKTSTSWSANGSAAPAPPWHVCHPRTKFGARGWRISSFGAANTSSMRWISDAVSDRPHIQQTTIVVGSPYNSACCVRTIAFSTTIGTLQSRSSIIYRANSDCGVLEDFYHQRGVVRVPMDSAPASVIANRREVRLSNLTPSSVSSRCVAKDFVLLPEVFQHAVAPVPSQTQAGFENSTNILTLWSSRRQP